MPADRQPRSASLPRRSAVLGLHLRRSAALLLIALASLLVGCGGSEVQTTPTSLEKPPLAVPEGSLAGSSSKKSGSTGATSTNSSTDTSTGAGSDTGADTGTDTGGAGTDTGGADNGTGTGTGTGGADTGGAGPGN